jgi:hypothetical protein
MELIMDNTLDLNLFKTSSCGTTVNSDIDAVDVKYDYTWTGWFFITFFGTTQYPREISFRCKETNEIFEILKDKSRIKHYLYYRTK